LREGLKAEFKVAHAQQPVDRALAQFAGQVEHGLGNCSDLQTSGVGIANIRPIGARSLQMALGHKPTITATEPRLIANGIANIRSVRTLIATQRWEAIPTAGFVILPLWSNDWPPSCKEIRRYDLKLYLDRITDFLA
jgi:hypothetical protein